MIIEAFLVAFVVSFLGSIPPGSISITTMQLSIRQQKKPAFYFALGASFTELIYAGITVRFQIYLSSQPAFTAYFGLVSSLVLLVLGMINLFAKHKKPPHEPKAEHPKGRSGFKQGIMLGLLNPMTIPFWLAVTAYLEANGWVVLGTNSAFYSYTIGIAAGTLVLLLGVNKLGSQFESIANNRLIVYQIPGLTFLAMGSYGLVKLFF